MLLLWFGLVSFSSWHKYLPTSRSLFCRVWFNRRSSWGSHIIHPWSTHSVHDSKDSPRHLLHLHDMEVLEKQESRRCWGVETSSSSDDTGVTASIPTAAYPLAAVAATVVSAAAVVLAATTVVCQLKSARITTIISSCFFQERRIHEGGLGRVRRRQSPDQGHDRQNR